MKFEELLDKDGYLAYTIKGVSMRPLLCQGRDVVIIQKLKDDDVLNKYDVVLFKRNKKDSDDYVLHRILKILPDERFWIVGDNCFSGEKVKRENILGVLTEIKRNNKTVDTNSLLHKLYVNTWCRFYHVRFALLRIKKVISSIVHKILNDR